jgi:GNAT superfamily N-acetyltransferase
MQSRPYANDLPKIQAATAEWIALAGFEGYLHVEDIALRLFNGMRHYQPSEIVRLWEDIDNKLLGWSMLYPRWKSFEALLHPDYRDSELTSEILDWAERESWTWMEKEGHADKPLGLDVFENDTLRIALLEQRGFARDEPTHVIGVRSLAEPIPDARLPEGFAARPIQGVHEADKVVAVLNAAFGWSGTADEHRQFMSFAEFSRASPAIVAPDGRFAACCYVMLDTRNGLGMFEDVATHPDFQRMGLGKALLCAGMKQMKKQGMHTALVPYEASLGPASKLYESVGFAPMYRLWNYMKGVHNPS